MSKQKKLALEKSRAEAKAKILKAYASFVRKHKRPPTHAEFDKTGVSRNAVRHNFGTPRELKEAARLAYPKVFENIVDEMLFTPENFARLEGEVEKYKTFVVTTAVTGCKVHKGFYRALKSYCEKNEALLLIIPITDPASTAGWNLDPILKDERIAFENLELNSNIHVSGIKMSAKQIDPTTGLNRIAQNSSFIYGSPKQRLRVVPNSNHKLPHVLMGTGALTIRNYETIRYMSQRTAFLADFDHKLGAIVVELDADERYYFRQLQAEPKSGNFVDLAKYYTSSGMVSTMQPEAFALGDWHSGETDPVAARVWKEVVAETQPKDLIIHDLFNGDSVSHWVAKRVIRKAVLSKQGKTNLTEELKKTAEDLAMLYSLVQGRDGMLRISKSNHDDFLARYLDDGRFMKDPENFEVALKLAAGMVEGKDPIQMGVEMFLPPELQEKIHWLKRDEDFRIARIECGVHGDRGPNGSKGTLANLEACYRACVVGHSHTPGILRDAWQIGTSSILNPEYNVGASSWMHTSCLIYPNGSRQLINSIYGYWRRQK